MSQWDADIFSRDVNQDFLDDLINLDDEDIIEAIEDACALVARQDSASDDELENGLCAATIAAIWAGAPYSAAEFIESYPFIRSLRGEGSESLNEVALEVLENHAEEDEVEEFIEALS